MKEKTIRTMPRKFNWWCLLIFCGLFSEGECYTNVINKFEDNEIRGK